MSQFEPRGKCSSGNVRLLVSSPERFDQMAQNGDFIEHAWVHEQRYGTSKAEVLSKLEDGQDGLELAAALVLA